MSEGLLYRLAEHAGKELYRRAIVVGYQTARLAEKAARRRSTTKCCCCCGCVATREIDPREIAPREGCETHPPAVGALNAVSASAGLDNTDQTVAVSNVVTISSRTVNETRGQFTRSKLTALPTDPIGPAVSISGIASFGTLSGSPTARFNNLYEVDDNLSHRAGAHALRAGVDFLYNDTTITYPRSIRGAYTFSSLANFLSGTYNNAGFTQTFGNSQVAQTNPNIGFYGQDEWKVSSRLTVNLGLRYDLQYLKTIATDTNNVSPRAGFACVSLRFPSHNRAWQLRSLLRSRSAAGAGQCAPLWQQHNEHHQHQPAERQSVAHPSRGARVPKHPAQQRPTDRRSGQLHDHEPAYAKCLFRAGERGD